MKKRSASSRSGARVIRKKRSIAKNASALSVEEFDRLADLPAEDPAGDLTQYLDLSKARRPAREIQRVNVDFPVGLLAAIDREAKRIGVTRQAFIKLRLADTLSQVSVSKTK